MTAWLDSIESTLRTSLGTNTRKREVFAVAKEMDGIGDSPMANALRALYRTWVVGQHYLYDAAKEQPDWKPSTLPPLPPLEGGKRDSKESRQYRLDKQADAARDRVARYSDARRDGWNVDEARCFVVTEEEAVTGETRYRTRAA